MDKNTEPFYLYLLELPSYGPEDRAKIGVSKNPEKRLYLIRRKLNPVASLYFKWPMCRSDAFRIEAVVKKNFPKYLCNESFKVTPLCVKNFVEGLL